MLGSDSPSVGVSLLSPTLATPAAWPPRVLELTGQGAWRSEVLSKLVTLVLTGWKVSCRHPETQSPWALRGGMGLSAQGPGREGGLSQLCGAGETHCTGPSGTLLAGDRAQDQVLSQDGPFRACSGLTNWELERSWPCQQ